MRNIVKNEKHSKLEIMLANKFKQELVALKSAVNEASKVRDYQQWVEESTKTINQINARIRATNKKWGSK